MPTILVFEERLDNALLSCRAEMGFVHGDGEAAL